MKGRLAFFACAYVLALAGCGGGGGSTTTTRSADIQGIWDGNSTSQAGSATFDVQFVQNGSNLSGTVEFVLNGNVDVGTFTGTVNGNNVSVTVNFGAFGTTTCNFTVSGSTITGTANRTVNGTTVDSGQVSISKSGTASSADVNHVYTGTTTASTAGSQPVSLFLNITQAGDALTFVGNSNNVIPLTGTGAIVGSTFVLHMIHTGTTGYTDLFGTVNGSAITGTYLTVGTNGNSNFQQTGTFSVNVSAQAK